MKSVAGSDLLRRPRRVTRDPDGQAMTRYLFETLVRTKRSESIFTMSFSFRYLGSSTMSSFLYEDYLLLLFIERIRNDVGLRVPCPAQCS